MSHTNCAHESTPKARSRCRLGIQSIEHTSHRESSGTSGIYVVEIAPGIIKVGLSIDAERRISTHIRNARGVGANPERFHILPCPEHMLRKAESSAHKAVGEMGGQTQAHTPEVFSGVHFEPVVDTVSEVVEMTVAFDQAIERLRLATSGHLRFILDATNDDIRAIVYGVLDRF